MHPERDQGVVVAWARALELAATGLYNDHVEIAWQLYDEGFRMPRGWLSVELRRKEIRRLIFGARSAR